MSNKYVFARDRVASHALSRVIAVGILASTLAQAEQAVPDTSQRPGLALREEWKQGDAPGEVRQEEPTSYRRFVMLVMANAYPGLDSEELIDRFFNTAMRLIAPGFDDVTTFSDMRNRCQLWVPNIGGGYVLSKRFAVFLTIGYGAGPVRTKANDPSIFLLPLHTDFEMQRSAFTVTPGLDFFPFGMVEQQAYHGLMDRLRGSKPMLGVRLPWTYAGYKVHAKVGLKPLSKLVDAKLDDAWSIWSANLNVGLDVPLTRRNQLNVNIGHSFFFARDYDFGGTVFSLTWKYFF
ncbi:MAG: hypothetical protein GWP08_01010 [Nitrospiraceae bacterium]|nr:hypothetical protein [Nitrospiraceae bacterium]